MLWTNRRDMDIQRPVPLDLYQNILPYINIRKNKIKKKILKVSVSYILVKHIQST